MEPLLAIMVGVLFAGGLYLMLRRNFVRVVIGLILISNAANLLLFTMGRMTRGIPPLIAEGQQFPPEGSANPLTQALILTAIVIGFGLLAYALALALRTYKELKTVDLDRMRVAEPLYPGEERPIGEKSKEVTA